MVTRDWLKLIRLQRYFNRANAELRESKQKVFRPTRKLPIYSEPSFMRQSEPLTDLFNWTERLRERSRTFDANGVETTQRPRMFFFM